MKLLTAFRTVFAQRKYWWLAGIAGLAVFVLYYALIMKVTTIPRMFAMSGPTYTVIAIIMLVVISALFGINVAFFWYKRASKITLGLKEGIGSTTGAFFGSVAAGCPVCGAFLLSLVGITSGLAIFPLKGIEVQFFSAALLLLSLHWSSKNIIDCDKCGVKLKRKGGA